MSTIITISAPVHATESELKVKKALKNLFPILNFTRSGKELTTTSENIESLTNLKKLLRSQKIRLTANNIMKKLLIDNKLVFYLNKQAAYVGKVNFSKECPLGPITICITGDNLRDLIDSLSPRTSER